jgi:hypothetical protein
MTAVQAQDMRFLGGYVGAMFMGSARVLGEESVVRAESSQEKGEKGVSRWSKEKVDIKHSGKMHGGQSVHQRRGLGSWLGPLERG